MKTAQWIYYPGESDGDSPLYALVADNGTVLSETDTKPTLRGNRELSQDWGVMILETIADG